MNTVDATGSIVMKDEENNSMSFLDAKFTRKEDGSVKSTVYRPNTHTVAYLSLKSMWLSILGLKSVTDNTKEKKKINSGTKNKDYRSQVLIPYMEGVSERIHRVMKKYGVATAMRPTPPSCACWYIYKVELAEQGELVYQTPCKNYGAQYIGGSVENTTRRTQEGRRQGYGKRLLMSNFNKSVLTDHSTAEHHIIDWERAKRTQQIKEAIWTRKTKTPMNKDEGNYELPHVYDDVIRH